MDLRKAKDIKHEINELILSKNNIRFPRIEIKENNYILYDYFSEKITKQNALERFKQLYDKTDGSADHVFLASNYAVFMMINNNLKEAKQILLEELDNVRDEQEGTYNYRITVNLAVCEFLINNNKRFECIQHLESIKYNREDPHFTVRNKELNGIIDLMKTISQCNDATIWCKAYQNRVSTPFNYYTTYQQGLIFTTLFDWDDD